jgi:threonylcarbamoyladenosine tRNA methylthiotransferase MtaB
LNQAETSTIERQFVDAGFDIVAFGEEAEVSLINTCTVTSRANQECRQMIRRAKRVSPECYVIVTGCYAQLEPGEIASIAGVNLVVGTLEKGHILELAGGMERLSCATVHVTPIDKVTTFNEAWTTEVSSKTRAFLKIQDGCDYTCSFCTIPRARGKSRSENLEDVLFQARQIAEHGFQEIVLTGVNVGDYTSEAGDTLYDVLYGLQDIDGLKRVRISSIEPNLVTDKVLDLIGSNDLYCKHLHLPMQSGSDNILRLMRRRYTTDLYRSRIRRILTVLPECGVGADVIVGFPGETPAEFETTHRFIADLPLSYLHVFTYSERPGTAAMSLPGSVPHHVRSERNKKLRVLGEKKRMEFWTGQIGRESAVLLESEVVNGCRLGFTDNYVRVGVPADVAGENTIVNATIEKISGAYCEARVAGDCE